MRFAFLVAVAAALSACARPPGIAVGADPSDPATKVDVLRYVPATGGLTDFHPTEPKPWTDSNRTVTPKAGGE